MQGVSCTTCVVALISIMYYENICVGKITVQSKLLS